MSASGTWNAIMNTPLGEKAAILELHISGNSLTGKMKAAQIETDIVAGTIAGNRASWKADLSSPLKITLEFTASFQDDAVTGDITFGAFGQGTFAGTRA